MGLMDSAKDLIDANKDKVADLATEHGDKAEAAVDKATDVIDDKTGGKSAAITDKVDDAAASAIDALKKD